jgi:hypothetical protein
MNTTKRPEEMPNAIPYPVSAISVSGLYRLSTDEKSPIVQRHEPTRETASRADESAENEYLEPQVHAGVGDPLSGPEVREQLRLDVDGQYPLMLASGTITRRLTRRIHWIANLKASGRFSWSGQIWFKNGATQLFPFTSVTITVTRSLHNHQRRATVLFTGGGAPNRVRGFRYASAYFREVGFELDFVEGLTPVTQIDTTAHPNHPSSLANETLSIDTVFRRAGFKPRDAAGAGLPIAGAGENALWSDMEMHDAMQSYWSKYSERAKWSLWTFFAARHEMGSSLGGIMFDDIGPHQRQGAAIFYDSFISQAPAGDSQPAAWVDRMRFWTAVHEMGHTFNLSHSWQKSLSSGTSGPWIPLADEPEARSFMNYPYNVAGGQTAFFSDFEYRFSDNELTFMRHAPESFVEQGNAPWFDEHGFEQANVLPERSLQLALRVNRRRPTFEFLEPVVLELKLTNISEQPQILPDDLIANSSGMTVIIKKEGQPARSFLPFAQYCRKPGQTVLRTGQSIYESLFVAADRNGWNLSEPGHYQVQVCLHIGKEDVVSNPLALRIAPPAEKHEEVLAQDFFSKDVGRVLAFDGSRFFDTANDTLRLVADKLEKRHVAVHAKVALLLPALTDVKRLELRDDGSPPQIVQTRAGLRQVGVELAEALGLRDAHLAAETLGHIDYNYYLNRFAKAIETEGAQNAGANAIDTLVLGHQTLVKRGVIQEALQPLDERIRRLDQAVPYQESSGFRAA